MSKRGRSTDENGRILDRLAGLKQVISADLVREVLQACGRKLPLAKKRRVSQGYGQGPFFDNVAIISPYRRAPAGCS